MGKNTLIILVIVSLFAQSLQDVFNNEIEVDEPNPYKEAASDIKREQDQLNVGGFMKTIMENGGNDLLGSLLSEVGKEGGGQLLQGLGAMFAGQNQGEKKSDSDSPNVLESLGSIANILGTIQALNNDGTGKTKKDGAPDILKSLGTIGSLLAQGQNNNGDGAAVLMQGLGSLLGQAGGGGRGQAGDGAAAVLNGLGSLLNQESDDNHGDQNEQSLDLGSILTLFQQDDKPQPMKKSLDSKGTGNSKDQPDFNMKDILSLVNTFLGDSGQKDGKKKPNNILSMLPTIMNMVNAFTGPEARSREKKHEGHASLMPPYLEKIHILFDHFIHSEMGKDVIAALGAEKSFKVFLDDKGKFSYQKFGDLMENHSYRRQWIRVLTDRIAEFLQYVTDPKIYKTYLLATQVFVNSYLKNEGYPKRTLFDPDRPVETISAGLNYLAKKEFQVDFNSRAYVEPIVTYIKELFKMSEKSGTFKKLSNSQDVSNKLADTINLEIIEPLVRVNRAIRFAKAYPKCDRYVLCLINKENENEAETLPGLKNLLYKGSSLFGGWFLSSKTGTSFWTLYTDITSKQDCKKLYHPECDQFHAEELRVTTEYIHNEL